MDHQADEKPDATGPPGQALIALLAPLWHVSVLFTGYEFRNPEGITPLEVSGSPV
jgi:hypothetical protein